MKIRFYQIALILIIGFSFKVNGQETQFSIIGNISNYPTDYAIFVQDPTGYGLSTKVDTIKIDDNGNFSFKTDLLNSNALLIFKDKKSIRLTIPNSLSKSIEINLDYLKPDSIIIKGEEAAFVQFYLDQRKYWKNIYQEMSNKHHELASRNNQSPKYHIIQDTITQLRIQYLYNYFEDLSITNKEDYIAAERNSLLYSNLYYRMSGQKDDIIKKLSFYNKSNVNSKSLTYSNEVNFSDKILFSNIFYRKFINTFIMNAVRVENPKDDFPSYPYELFLDKGFSIIDELYKMSEPNKLQKIIFINFLISKAKTFKKSVQFSEFQNAIENLRKNAYANEYLTVIEKNLQQLNNLISKFSSGAKAPDFKLHDLEGKVYGLSDFKNKTIFIDVWASWCGPCISSSPKWNELVEKYSKENNFQFISVSIDKDKSKWIKAIEKNSLNGLQLYAGSKGFDSPFAKDFEIKVIPNYISIDNEGNIISISSSITDLQKIINNQLLKE